jgi:hypothetical protein
MNLDHLGRPGYARGRYQAVLIGREPRVIEVEIVFKMMMRANN